MIYLVSKRSQVKSTIFLKPSISLCLVKIARERRRISENPKLFVSRPMWTIVRSRLKLSDLWTLQCVYKCLSRLEGSFQQTLWRPCDSIWIILLRTTNITKLDLLKFTLPFGNIFFLSIFIDTVRRRVPKISLLRLPLFTILKTTRRNSNQFFNHWVNRVVFFGVITLGTFFNITEIQDQSESEIQW